MEICNLAINDTDIEAQLEMFWRLEECSSDNKYSKDEQECEDHFIKTSFRDSPGKFTVRLPIKDSIWELGESKSNAIKRFQTVKRRLAKSPFLKTEYYNFMNEYIELGYMALVNDVNPTSFEASIYYLPHHCVVQENSSTIKVRVVFDGSAPSSSGISSA